MARKLKTYITSIGFFEEAIAAPSMKAALEAWGSSHNLFHQGLAKETNDPAIVAATMKEPGVILRRPIGRGGVFKAHAELPKNLIDKQPTEAIEAKPVKVGTEKAVSNAYERQKKRQERQRQKEAAVREKLQRKMEARKKKVQLAFKKSEKEHERRLDALKKQQAAINKKIEAEENRWDNQKERFHHD